MTSRKSNFHHMNQHDKKAYDAIDIAKTTRKLAKKLDIKQHIIPLQTVNHYNFMIQNRRVEACLCY